MRAVVQRVTRAGVTVDGRVTGSIDRGYMVLLGVEDGDGQADMDYICQKLVGLRVFEDAEGKMNLSIRDVGGDILMVSQFTLLGDARKGRRPSFIAAARPEEANAWYEKAVAALRAEGIRVETGIFQADMQVELVNDGPVTILLDSRRCF